MQRDDEFRYGPDETMRHVIIGTGPAGVVAAETLRRVDPSSEIIILGDEPEPPYSRMALPYLLADNVGESGTNLRHGTAHFEKLAIDVRRNRVNSVDTGNRVVIAGNGAEIAWDRLLIATGAHPIKPPIEGMDAEGVENCWTLADARRILAGAKPGSRVVLMGAGFIGCIVLEALAARGVDLVVVEMADRMLPRMMDETGGAMIARWCESKGVAVRTGTRVTEIARSNGSLVLSAEPGDPIEADLVVCATGVAPNIDFLAGTGIESDAGILVDHRLRTSARDVYAAGDVAQGPDFSTGQQEVHAIQPTAVEHGRIAALNMAGIDTPFRGSLSMNVLNTLGLVSSSFGLWMGTEGGERCVAADEAHSRYLRLEFEEDRIVGALALGLTQHVGVLRGLIQTRVRLGSWMRKLRDDPNMVMNAYLECTQGSTQ
jgi:NADPH-dependent 2,4-dienoyl-CoA reductase/sulfur reductase-like enzyme